MNVSVQNLYTGQKLIMQYHLKRVIKQCLKTSVSSIYPQWDMTCLWSFVIQMDSFAETSCSLSTFSLPCMCLIQDMWSHHIFLNCWSCLDGSTNIPLLYAWIHRYPALVNRCRRFLHMGEEMPFSHLKSSASYALLDMRKQITVLFQDSELYDMVKSVILLWKLLRCIINNHDDHIYKGYNYRLVIVTHSAAIKRNGSKIN